MDLLQKKAFVDENIHLLPESELNSFNFNFACVYTKNSVGMESGNTQNLADVVGVIRGVSNNRFDEDLKRSLYSHYSAFYKMQEDLKASDGILSEDVIKDLHTLIVNGSMPGGLYRNVNIMVNGSKHIPCSPEKIYSKMQIYIETANSILDPIDKACYVHLRFAKIHPFLDGNGRVSRLILNYSLMNDGFLPISIPAKRRMEYFDTLEEYKINGNVEPFKNFMLELLNKEYDRLIELIEPYLL